MQVTPVFLGACALMSIAGAVGGATINTQPIQKAGIGSEMLPRTDIAFDPSDDGLPEAAPPDQYALSTPDGRVEIAELSVRGLYSQQRFGWHEASYEPPPLPPWPEPSGEWSIEESAGGPAHAEAAPAVVAAQAVDEPAVTPRMVDVATELAAL